MSKQTKSSVKKPNIFKRAGTWISRSFAELKKVTWPTFPTVMKNLSVVLIVVLCFVVIVGACDLLFSWLLGLLG